MCPKFEGPHCMKTNAKSLNSGKKNHHTILNLHTKEHIVLMVWNYLLAHEGIWMGFAYMTGPQIRNSPTESTDYDFTCPTMLRTHHLESRAGIGRVTAGPGRGLNFYPHASSITCFMFGLHLTKETTGRFRVRDFVVAPGWFSADCHNVESWSVCAPLSPPNIGCRLNNIYLPKKAFFGWSESEIIMYWC